MKRFLLVVLFCGVALFGLNETLAFIGPSASPPSGAGELLVASSTRALGITTSTVYFTPSSLTIKPNGASTPSIFFDSDGDIGIATTTPGQKLVVVGSAKASGFIGSGASLTSLDPTNLTAGAFTASNFAFPQALAVGTSTTEGLPGNGLLVLSTTTLATESGSVGIGTTNPQRVLHIQSNNATVRVDRDVDTTALMLVRTAQGDFSTIWKSFMFGTNASGVNDGYFFVSDLGTAVSGGGTNRFTISNNGYVGVGTTTPQAKFHVEGEEIRLMNANGSNPTRYIYIDRGANGINAVSQTLHLNRAETTDVTLVAGGGNVAVGTTTPAYKLDVFGTARFTQPIIVGEPTASTHATTKSYVDSVSTGASGVWLQTGSYLYASSTSWNVGVGTQTPLHRLQVSRAASTTTRTARFDMTGGTSGTEYTVAQFDVGGSGAQSPAIAISSNATIGLKLTHTNSFARAFIDHNYSSATALAFGLRGAEYMRIDNNGYVGIGITNPSSSLHIAEGGFLTFQTPGTTKGGINFYETGTISNSSVQYGATVRYDPGADRLEILTRQDSVDTYGIAIARATGNVGIGGTTTAYKLDVTGTGRFTQPIVVGTPTASTHATTKSYVDSVLSGSTGVWLQSGSNLYASSTSWNVAIGTTDAGSYKLNVEGAAYSSTGWEGPTSDIRLKKNVATLSNVLGKLENVRGVSFDWRFGEFPERNFPDERQIGVIAQELERAFPELVTTDPHGYKLVRYTQLSAVLLQGIKEQQLEIEGLEARIKKLEVRNTDTEE